MKKRTQEVEVKREYRWRAGAAVHNQSRLDVNQIGELIEHIMEDRSHRLSAGELVDIASDPGSPLHDAFEWDDSEAAKEMRKIQARHLLRSYTITIVREDKPDVVVRANMAIESAGNHRESTYGGTVAMLSDEEMRSLLLRQAIGKLIALKKSYGELQELAQVFAHIDEIAKRVA